MSITMEPETETKSISDSDVVYTMREIVQEFGKGYIYKGEDEHARCLYREDGKPSCLVGQVFARLTPDYTPQEVGVGAQRNRLHEAGYSKNATYALQIAQNVQDRRHTWDAALTAASSILEHAPEDW